MKGQMGIISGRYRSRERKTPDGPKPETVLELFGRSDEGSSICLLVHGQRPTFECAPIGEWHVDEGIPPFLVDRIKHVKAMEHVVDVSGPVIKWTQLGERPVWTIETEQPFHVPALRKTLRSQSWQVFSGDIPFVNRLFLDRDIGMHVAFTADVVDRRVNEDDNDILAAIVDAGGEGRYPVDLTLRCDVNQLQAAEPFQVPFRIFSFDLETSIEHETVLCAAAWIEDIGTGRREVFTYRGDEADILKQLTATVREQDPDIITGYNIDNFDLPRLADRTQALKRGWELHTELFGWGRVPQRESELKRQRDALVPKRQSNRAWNLAGRAVMDTWWQARQALKPRRETLSFVATLLFPDDEDKHKMDVDASNMDEEWATRPDEVMAYCERDAALPLDILKAIQAVPRKEAVAAVAKVPFETAANGSTSQLIDSLVIRLADQQQVAVPLTGSAEAKVGQITGGYVHDVEAGLHPWIAVLDFKSMYPSIMIARNICYTTRVDPAQSYQPVEGESLHEAPTGAVFRPASARKGMVPALLENLMAQRDEHKAALKKAQREDRTVAVEFHDSMQYAVKILMNSFYGVFASGFYRFTHRDLGSSITAWARQNIKSIIAAVEDEGHGVVYSDTDSIFVRCPIDPEIPRRMEEEELVLLEQGDKAALAKEKAYKEGVQSMVKFGQELAKRYSRESAILEFERGLSVFFSHGAKKRYIGQVVWPSEEMLIRGYETQRTDSFPYLTETMKEIFKFALADQGDALVEYAIHRVQDLNKTKVNPQHLVLAKSCKGRVVRTPVKSPEDVDFTKDYANPDGMAQVRVARRRIELGLGFTTGMKVSYLVTDASRSPMKVTPWLEAESMDEEGYDGRFYAERLAAALGRITEAFGWSAKDLMKGNKQASLFDF